VQHIEQFGPILVETLARILQAPPERKALATAGLAKLLERDTKGIKKDLEAAEDRLASYLDEKKQRLSEFFGSIEDEEQVSKAERKAVAAAAAAAGAAPKGKAAAASTAKAAVTPIDKKKAKGAATAPSTKGKAAAAAAKKGRA
jgi:peptidoglycan hydrolase CwlO-like protein